MKYETLLKRSIKNAIDFKEIAETLIDIDDSHEDYEDAVKGIALGMSMGATLKQIPHILTGVTIGVGGTIIVSKISKKFKKKEGVTVNLRELVQVIETSIDIETEKLKKKSKED